MKRTVVSWSLAAILGLATLALPASEAFAGPATDVVREKQTALFALLKAPKPDQTKIGALFDAMLDYDALAKASLGDEWGKLSSTEQTEFRDLLKSLVRKAYEKNLKKTIDFTIQYDSEQEEADTVLVHTKAVNNAARKGEEPFEISFRMRKLDDGTYRVADIVTEGVSLVSSYKSQFVKIIKKDGFAALATKMKEKAAKGDG